MAQNLTVAGASYSDVPALELPVTGGGTASFYDVSDTTATASDVASGATFYAADGTLTTGTASGGGSTLTTKSITSNGTYNASDDSADGYSSVTVNVSGSDPVTVSDDDVVIFIDYDGTVLYAYDSSEFAQLSSLPNNPTHSGLTSQGWNWTLAQIQAQLTAYPTQPIYVGQHYVTDDDTTRLYCEFQEGRLYLYFSIAVNGTVTIDWGDNTSTSTLTGSSASTLLSTDHTYGSAGSYVITLTVSSGGLIYFTGGSTTTNVSTYLLRKDSSTSASVHWVMAATLHKVEFGSSAVVSDSAFRYCTNLETITVPANNSYISAYAFEYCYSLKSFVMSNYSNNIPNYAFRNCASLKLISISPSTTIIGLYAFYNCYNLVSMTMPSGLISLGNYAFAYCHALHKMMLPSGITTIPTYLCQGCSSLTSVTMSANLTKISNYAFSNDRCLTSITVPSGVTSILASAFSTCSGLGEIHFLPTTPPTIGNSNVLSSLPSDCIIYVPSGYLSAYTSASNYPSSSTYTYVEE